MMTLIVETVSYLLAVLTSNYMSKKTVISKIRAHINSSVDPQKEMNEFKDMLSELAKEKKRKCVKKNKDGASYFDYYEMAKMIHDGEW